MHLVMPRHQVGTGKSPRLLLWMVRRPYPRPVVDEMLATLARANVVVDQDFGERARTLDGPLPYDLCILKAHSDVSLSAAAAAEAAGNVVINRLAAVRAVRDKVEAIAHLRRAGLPVPPSWLAADQRHAVDELPILPVIIKPAGGDLGRDVHRVTSAAEAQALRARPLFGPVLIQGLVPSDGYDLKVYGIGERLYAVRKGHDASPADAGVPVPLPAEAADLAGRCRELFGLEFFGVDLLDSGNGFVIVDVNHFPGFKGVVDAGRLLADHLLRRLAAVPA